jgi:hypothetical protein
MVKKLLAACAFFPYELAQSAEAVLASLLTSKVLDPMVCLAAVKPFLRRSASHNHHHHHHQQSSSTSSSSSSASGAPQLQALRLLAKLVPRVPSASLLHAVMARRASNASNASNANANANAPLPPEIAAVDIMPALVQAMSSELVDTRKASVLALVEVYCNVGDAVLPHLGARLSVAQMKLVTIYCEKRGCAVRA